MNLVVDASVVAKWFVKEDLSEQAEALMGRGDLLFAPELLLVELANALWKKVRRGEIGPEQARRVPGELRDGVPELFSMQPLFARALQIGIDLRHPVYDCTYLACAEAVDGVVVTSDGRFARAVAGTTFADRACHVSDLPPP